MKNKIPLFALLVLVAVIVFAFLPKDDTKIDNSKGIQFIESDWKKALEEAKKQHKLIFLDAYASWCGPCKMLKRKTFPNQEVGDFFNQNFVNVAIDMEKGVGPSLSELFSVDAYPTLIITDADGNMLTYTKGFMEPKQLMEFGKQAITLKKK
ncbi:MAG: thioredoxin family protein [Sediminibacterium sp.]|nr:thioredoxin family protein [Sediminibacterium sp.]